MNWVIQCRRGALGALFYGWAVVLGLLGAGCAQVQVPAIDPTGEAVLAPRPTTLVSPFSGSPCLSRLPCFSRLQPAFTTPATPPPCPPPTVQSTVPQASVPKTITGRIVSPEKVVGAILMSPARIVAPVGSEVILSAGICGMEGHYVMRQPMEWTVKPGTVGQIVDFSRCHQLPWCFGGDRPVAAAQVLSRTITRARLFSRGTPDPSDDVVVQPGQSWVRVTSVNEGTSLVSIAAPNADLWDGNPQVAAIHWVEAQWSLPAAASLRTGERHTLSTVVTRPSTGEPIAGWLVRYEITEGLAQFAPGGGTVTEVPTDVTGAASIEITADQATAARIRVRIIRPAKTSADLSRLVVGEGWSAVTWSAPGLAVNIAAPNVVAPGSDVTYQVVVANPGDMPTSDIVVLANVPPGMQFVSSEPPAMQYGDRVEWRIGQLGPKTSSTISVNCRGQERGTHRFCVTATSGLGLRADSCADTRIVVPAIALSMSGPDRAEVGQQVEFQLLIRNQSDRPLSNVILTDQFDPGLEHVDGQVSPIQKGLGRDLQPGETARIAVEFRVTRAGTLCHLLDVRADGGHSAQARSCLTAVDPQPRFNAKVQARITGPVQQVLGRPALYKLSVRNVGDVTLRGIRVHYTFAPSLAPSQASGEHRWHEGGLLWDEPDAELSVGEARELQVLCSCQQLDPTAWSRITVKTSDQIVGTAATETEVIAPPSLMSSAQAQADSLVEENPSPAKTYQSELGSTATENRGGWPALPVVSENRDSLGENRPPIGPDQSTAHSADNVTSSAEQLNTNSASEGSPGELTIEFAAATNSCRLRSTAAYSIRIVNDRDVSDQRIALVVTVTEEMKIKRITSVQGYVDIKIISPDGRTWELVPIAELRSWEAISLRVQTTAVSPGDAQLRVRLSSQRSPDEIEREIMTTVAAN